jgi:hemoglobin
VRRRLVLRKPTGTSALSPADFDEVAAELGRTLDFVKVPSREKAEVLAAFAAHKDEVTAGYVAKHG